MEDPNFDPFSRQGQDEKELQRDVKSEINIGPCHACPVARAELVDIQMTVDWSRTAILQASSPDYPDRLARMVGKEIDPLGNREEELEFEILMAQTMVESALGQLDKADLALGALARMCGDCPGPSEMEPGDFTTEIASMGCNRPKEI